MDGLPFGETGPHYQQAPPMGKRPRHEPTEELCIATCIQSQCLQLTPSGGTQKSLGMFLEWVEVPLLVETKLVLAI